MEFPLSIVVSRLRKLIACFLFRNLIACFHFRNHDFRNHDFWHLCWFLFWLLLNSNGLRNDWWQLLCLHPTNIHPESPHILCAQHAEAISHVFTTGRLEESDEFCQTLHRIFLACSGLKRRFLLPPRSTSFFVEEHSLFGLVATSSGCLMSFVVFDQFINWFTKLIHFLLPISYLFVIASATRRMNVNDGLSFGGWRGKVRHMFAPKMMLLVHRTIVWYHLCGRWLVWRKAKLSCFVHPEFYFRCGIQVSRCMSFHMFVVLTPTCLSKFSVVCKFLLRVPVGDHLRMLCIVS
mmetsp:Transcript_31520/g.50595  ORF Transcript_31520/g.50595 Transcript_31520/m.50595 type:complete len:292 (+) Transcript_31520:208-1083(+)